MIRLFSVFRFYYIKNGQDGSLVPSLYYLLNNKDMFSRVYVVNGDEAATTEPDMFRVILLVLEHSLFVGS